MLHGVADGNKHHRLEFRLGMAPAGAHASTTLAKYEGDA